MSKKVKLFLLFYFGVVVLFFTEILYLQFFASQENFVLEQKKQFNHLVSLGGLAISDESYIRHPSADNTFEIYSLDGSLREHTKQSILYRPQSEAQ